MTAARAEPFHLALATVRERLRAGAFAPGARIAAGDLADALRLSTTPVREALAHLAGEGLLEERRGQGFFTRLLAASDIADLYRLSLAHLLIAQDPHRPRRGPPPEGQRAPAPDPLQAVEQLFLAWVDETGSRALIAAFAATTVQLGPVRRLEPLVFDDLEAEADGLAAVASGTPRLAALRQFHGRRIRVAEALAALLARPPGRKI